MAARTRSALSVIDGTPAATSSLVVATAAFVAWDDDGFELPLASAFTLARIDEFAAAARQPSWHGVWTRRLFDTARAGAFDELATLACLLRFTHPTALNDLGQLAAIFDIAAAAMTHVEEDGPGPEAIDLFVDAVRLATDRMVADAHIEGHEAFAPDRVGALGGARRDLLWPLVEGVARHRFRSLWCPCPLCSSYGEHDSRLAR